MPSGSSTAAITFITMNLVNYETLYYFGQFKQPLLAGQVKLSQTSKHLPFWDNKQMYKRGNFRGQ